MGSALTIDKEAYKLVMFVDMNSFFASCEQEAHPEWQGKPIGVCPYLGANAAVIAASIEAKKMGVKSGMRLRDARRLCPDIIPVETTPDLYREKHVQIMNVLRHYSEEVIPKSIDEAIIDLTNYRLVYKDPIMLADQIRRHIKKEAGQWLKCSIGIAPNAFLAKLGSDIKKPEGTTVITRENIDEVLKTLILTDLPGIAENMAFRLQRGGIMTPYDLRHADPSDLKRICRSIVGVQWHYRLNFGEMDMRVNPFYKHMQAMRHVSMEQRSNPENLKQILLAMCMTLEGRMVKQGVFARDIYVNFTYSNKDHWADITHTSQPIQDGTDLHRLVWYRIDKYEQMAGNGPIVNSSITALGVGVGNFVRQDASQMSLFDINVHRKDTLRQTVYGLKNRFGKKSVVRAAELSDQPTYKDMIGFGSIKDMYQDGQAIEDL